MFGNPETTTGGRALKFYSSVRLEIRRGEQIKDGTSAIGNRTTIKVVKIRLLLLLEPVRLKLFMVKVYHI